MNGPDRGDQVYQVVISEEGHYSVWPADSEIPAGWSTIGVVGPKASCLAHIERTWTDMRPRSLREQMEGGEPGG